MFDEQKKRILPHQPLPRQYDFLTKHSAKSFIVGYTLDKSDAPFETSLVIAHGLGYPPLHDMWYAETESVTGDYRADYNPYIEPVWHTPSRVMGGFGNITTTQEYYLSTTVNSATVHFKHALQTSGVYHVYFHIKLYMDDFFTQSLDGTPWQVSSPSFK